MNRAFASRDQPAPLTDQRHALREQAGAAVHGLRERVVQPRLVVGLALIASALLWAALRGLEFYGLGPIDLAYDLDQPPILLLLVGVWLSHRSRLR